MPRYNTPTPPLEPPPDRDEAEDAYYSQRATEICEMDESEPSAQPLAVLASAVLSAPAGAEAPGHAAEPGEAEAAVSLVAPSTHGWPRRTGRNFLAWSLPLF